MDAKEFGNFIVQLRKENHMTQAELGKKIQVSDKAVSRWERGQGFPDISTIEPVAEALGVTVAEIMKCQKNEESDEKTEEVNAAIGIIGGADGPTSVWVASPIGNNINIMPWLFGIGIVLIVICAVRLLRKRK